MGKLIYAAICSLDTFIEDESGGFDWAAPDEEVHAYVNDLERPIGTYLYGRRMYETMRYWETEGSGSEDGAVSQDYAHVWRAADKVVFSRTLEHASTARSRIEPGFDAAAVRALKESSEQDISIGGPEIAAEAFRAGLVDEVHLFLHPIVVGSGKKALPHDVRVQLGFLGERRFRCGVVHLHYRVSDRPAPHRP